MAAGPKKHIEQLKRCLIENLTLDYVEEPEIQSVLAAIYSFDQRIRQKVFALCVSLSHASSSLVPNALARIGTVSKILTLRGLEKWLDNAFDLLDSKGIAAALNFLAKNDAETLRNFESPEGLSLKKILPVLETYLRGISGMELKILPDKASYTDTVYVCLPTSVSHFKEKEKNLFVYKFMVVQMWAQISQGTLTPDPGFLSGLFKGSSNHPDIETLFRFFSERQLAIDLYNLLEAIRLDTFLRTNLPSLMTQADSIRTEIFEERPDLCELPEKTAFIEGLFQYYLKGAMKGYLIDIADKLLKEMQVIREAKSSSESIRRLFRLYDLAIQFNGYYQPLEMLIPGTIRPSRVSYRLKSAHRERRKKLESVINELITMPEIEPLKPLASKPLPHERLPDPEKEYLVIKGRVIELDNDAIDLVKERGGVPGGILVKGSELGSGRSCITLRDLAEEEEVSSKAGGIKYDEWDYRRGDYRKNWCSLYELEVHPGHEPFVELTLLRYAGYVITLRKKFELLKGERKILRRQKYGDDVDVDATVEAFSDIHAGISPSENLFVRLDRQERNIAALFLLDMSGSTKGWVIEAEKEALVLMCEALESLGDRYAIFGFSGMTRTRCDFYRIKTFYDAYSEGVKQRISGITPKDYTRMGPPLRHSVKLLKSIEARTKLLITLSDGKPEDWDAYKGDYAVEDTRKALIEAREQGIHSFCITIDEGAQSYLPHMYGETNYIFIDDVRKLPNKITDIYRRLTT